jgi:DNA (cytosine-5)-methyltransferase 1
VSFVEKANIFNTTVAEFIRRANEFVMTGEVDGVIGGPPCQPFSTIGKRLGLSDPRAEPLNDYVALVALIKPKFFLFENVPNLAWQWKGQVLGDLIEKLSGAGDYQVEHRIVNAADYGAFTKRRRLLIIGIRRDCLQVGGIFPRPTHTQKSTGESCQLSSWRTVSDALEGVSAPNSRWPTHHDRRNHTLEVVQRFKLLKPGEQDKKRKRWRLDPYQPSNSLMAGGEEGFIYHIHPIEPRELTSRECARIQGFPDQFDFSGTPLDVAKQIVNAVPMQLGASVARSIAVALERPQ